MSGDLTVSDHRQAFERLYCEYLDLHRRRAEFGPLPAAIMLAALVKAMAFHMRFLAAPKWLSDGIERTCDAKTAGFLGAPPSMGRILDEFEKLSVADPAGADRLVSQFAEGGKFIVAARETPCGAV